MLSNSSGDFEHTLLVVVVVGEGDEVKDASLPFPSEPSSSLRLCQLSTGLPGTPGLLL